ncbi:hypothetical protein N7537_003290 [Penicillium hordei]|uniref:Uncharacterized protein n=1 Tax=Penicillium hordei TaxID=40994 RepID=A0AAD6MPT0_9EURO|nr:uncharacterized protein N7537_003290 [Penicillium hordei]KAJ5618176.1 hypothetical protein N7537_003290 [Penicillium hordei]
MIQKGSNRTQREFVTTLTRLRRKCALLLAPSNLGVGNNDASDGLDGGQCNSRCVTVRPAVALGDSH